MTAAAYAPLPAEMEVVDAPVSNLNIAELEKTRVLFFAGDAVNDNEKRDLPFKEFGGIYLPHIKTLPKQSKGMLYRCQLTRLSKYTMIPDWKNMLGPQRAALQFEDSFVQEVVTADGQREQRTVSGFLTSDPEATKEGEFKLRKSDHVVYKKRYAGQDAQKAVKRLPPHGAGGVVEIKALIAASAQEVREAQLFFFPDWVDIRRGIKPLPNTIREIQEHLTARKEAVKSQDWSEDKKQQYFSIADDMIRSCVEFRRYAMEAVRSDENIVKNAVQQGLAGQIIHSVSSEKMLEQTEAHRKDDVLMGQSNDVGALAQEMRADREARAQREAKELELRERELFLKEIELGIRNPDGSMKNGNVTTRNEAPATAPTPEVVGEGADIEVEAGSAPEGPAIGDIISTSRGDAEVIGKPFGRVKVKVLETGQEGMLDKLEEV